MSIAIFLAVLAGVGASVFAVRRVSAALAKRARNPIAIHRAGYVGVAIATLPAFFASVTIGGNFGGSWLEELAGSSTVPLGVGVGMFIVFVAIMLIVGVLTTSIARLWVGTMNE